MIPHHPDTPHAKYTHTRRHWCPLSEPYTGGDSLLSALREGWTVSDVIVREDFQSGSRSIPIYHFELSRKGETVAMRVIGNPYITRLITEQGWRLVSAVQYAYA